MRIVIDMQGAQSESRFRGIGRYVLSFAEAVCRLRGKHEVILALNGELPESIESIRRSFSSLLPPENIRIWCAPGPVNEFGAGNDARREVAELVYEAFLTSLNADIIHVGSLFEGYIDDAVSSIGRFDNEACVTTTLYDLIPLLNPDRYLNPEPQYRTYYERKIGFLKKSAAFLCISESARQEGLGHLRPCNGQFFNISTGLDKHFERMVVDDAIKNALFARHNIVSDFILYTGGADERKNLPRLIEAFALLPENLKRNHQLVLAGKIADDIISPLIQHAAQLGVKATKIIFTGYVSDEDLVALYNLCKLFVFPSWHEGFGLPALEAMGCGAPVIASHNSSLPEVIDFPSALFNPLDSAAISAKMQEVLENDDLRMQISEHGIQQAKKFTWERTANRAINVWELLYNEKLNRPIQAKPPSPKQRLVIVSPLPPIKSGIADYTSTLIPALSEYYDIDVVVAQDHIDMLDIEQYAKIRDIKWLRQNASHLNRVLYQMGNSPFHQHMLELIKEVPGIVVLHDFFLSGLLAWLEINNGKDHVWKRAIFDSHGYGALQERLIDTEAAKCNWPANFEMLRRAEGVIVHSDHSRDLARRYYDFKVSDDWIKIPLVRNIADPFDKSSVKKSLGFNEDDFVVCSFGFLDATKLNHLLIEAWFKSRLSSDPKCHLIFVGENHGGDYGNQLLELMASHKTRNPILITGFLSSEEFSTYLKIADLGVQLRTSSRGETSAAVLDCMNHSLPVIVNASGSMAEIDADAVIMLPECCSSDILAETIEDLWCDPQKRSAIGDKARNVISSQHTPAYCAAKYAVAIEAFSAKRKVSTYSLVQSIAQKHHSDFFDNELLALAHDIGISIPAAQPSKRLFLDITATHGLDHKTGIERVVREILIASLDVAAQINLRIEPVYLANTNGDWQYRYARRYMQRLIGVREEFLSDDLVDFQSDDSLLGLDLSGETLVQAYQSGLFQKIRDLGIQVRFMVHDLLPVRMPQMFPPGADVSHEKWLKVVAAFDGVVCVSESVACDFKSWLEVKASSLIVKPDFDIQWSHHGCDIKKSAASEPLQSLDYTPISKLKGRINFLMVGTIEPRKGYVQVIDAFTKLWQEGHDINLVLVGKEGWQGLPENLRRDIPATIEKIRNHPELNKHLYWFNNLTDDYLESLYSNSSALIAASYGEGFGLPLIEAAHYGLPLILRDINIFREVAGSGGTYFSADNGDELALSIKDWLVRFGKGNNPEVEKEVQLLTWRESALKTLSLCALPKQHSNAPCQKRRLLFDISVTYRTDYRTGIQRVVRGVLSSLRGLNLQEFDLTPVFLDTNQEGDWAYKTAILFDGADNRIVFDPEFNEATRIINPRSSDILLGLDLTGSYLVQAYKNGLFTKFRAAGAKLYFMVHDLLPVRMPHHFATEDVQGFNDWLEAIANADGVVCNSKATAADFNDWFKSLPIETNPQTREFKVMSFYLGADIENSSPSLGLPSNAHDLLTKLESTKYFISVGTLEPRKGYKQALDAFDLLWSDGLQVSWVIVGKKGWMMDEFAERLRHHPLLGTYLFWLEGISDEFLDRLYENASCLIAASEGEGFGIPIIEAAKHGLPIVARDIAVFREIGGDSIHYFNGTDPLALADSLKSWLQLYELGIHPSTKDVRCLTWQESTSELIETLRAQNIL